MGEKSMDVIHKIKLKRPSEYALALTAARENLGLKQTVVAKRIGISPQQLSHWEKGVRHPRLDQIDAWAKAIGYKVILKIENNSI